MVNFFSTRHLNKSSSRKGEETQTLGAAARRALLPLLSGIYRENSRIWLSKRLPDKKGVLGLHLGCGSGEDTFLLASLLNENYTLHGIEEDMALIEAARYAEAAGKGKQLHFFYASPFSCKTEEKYDLIYSRIWAPDLMKQPGFLSNAGRRLSEGGKLIVEAMLFSGYSGYPYNHAFDRSIALIAQLESSYADTSDWLKKLSNLFAGEQFQVLEINYSPPAFIAGVHNGVASLLLESFQEKLLRLHLANKEELNALIQELKHYETQQDTLISRPGVYQILVKKRSIRKK